MYILKHRYHNAFQHRSLLKRTQFKPAPSSHRRQLDELDFGQGLRHRPPTSVITPVIGNCGKFPEADKELALPPKASLSFPHAMQGTQVAIQKLSGPGASKPKGRPNDVDLAAREHSETAPSSGSSTATTSAASPQWRDRSFDQCLLSHLGVSDSNNSPDEPRQTQTNPFRRPQILRHRLPQRKGRFPSRSIRKVNTSLLSNQIFIIFVERPAKVL